MKSFSRKSFTLIEMLIVIVVIGILAAALIPRLQSIQGRARDSKRKTDLLTIYNANEIHKMDYGLYARANTCAYNVGGCHTYSTSGAMRIPMLSGILTSIPSDPINTRSVGSGWVTGNYFYQYGNVRDNPTSFGNSHGIMTYDMGTILENGQDPQICGLKDYRALDNSARCVTLYPWVYQISPHSIKKH